MSHLELTQRMLCSEARVDSKRIRTGNLQESDWSKISHAVGRLGDAPIWIDDNPNLTVMEIRAKARRLKAKIGDLGLVIVDYLQLMTGRNGAESRQVEVSEISRGLKILARELETPVVALSQLSRGLESRTDKRPMLADLRESGCLTADSRIVRADTGAEVTMGELLASGERNVPVWTLDERFRMVPGEMSHVFPSGTKRVYEITTASGRQLQASGNHPFLRIGGWVPVDDLAVGDHVAVARNEPFADADRASNTNVDVIPAEAWGLVRKAMTEHGVTTRALAAGLGMQYCGSALYKSGLSRERMRRVAEIVPDRTLSDLAESDVLWDRIVAIEDRGEQPVFDATVEGTHNFAANGIVVHNSIEQDADVVLFLYRDEVYDPESPHRGTAEIIVSKHRNGPTGVARVAFLPHFTRFENMAKGV
jgi:replicative DNA helicase